MKRHPELVEALLAFVRQQADDFPEERLAPIPSLVAWQPFAGLGTSLWLDTGDIDAASQLWCREFDALTTNNTLLNREVQTGQYDELVKKTAERIAAAKAGLDDDETVREIAFVLNARHALRLVQRFGAHVSVELHTDCANDVELTLYYARRFYAICPEMFYVKVPFTAAGLIAGRRLDQTGIPVNMTLGFAARQNSVIARFANPTFVNVFMGRLNAFVADNGLGDGNNVGEKATLATQRELLRLRAMGVSSSQLIGASMRSAEQVSTLAGLDVFTMPTKVAAGFATEPVQPTCNTDWYPAVTTEPGVNWSDFAGDTLWDVPEALVKATDGLLEAADRMTEPAAVQDHFAEAGAPDLLPAWSEAQIACAAKDGKIPVYDHWRDELRQGKIGLDALMNLSALQSFTADQAELDKRIRSLI